MSRAQNGRLIRLSVSAAVNGLSRNRLATVAATMTMTLMLLVLASVLVIRAGLDAALSYADSKVEVVAYLKVGASEERANSLRNEILKIDGVKEATYITADEALAVGLVNKVVPTDDLDTVVHELADTIARNAPLTIAAVKAAAVQLRRPESERDTAAVAALVSACFESADYTEGRMAFTEKRSPKFTGR